MRYAAQDAAKDARTDRPPFVDFPFLLLYFGVLESGYGKADRQQARSCISDASLQSIGLTSGNTSNSPEHPSPFVLD